MITNDLDIRSLLFEYELDIWEMGEQMTDEKVERIHQCAAQGTVFPFSTFEAATSVEGTPYVVEYAVSHTEDGDQALRFLAHALVHDAEGTTVWSLMCATPDGERYQADAPDGEKMLLRYAPTAVCGYEYYSGTTKAGAEMVGEMVGRCYGPTMGYWIGDDGRLVCMQCRGGYMLGRLEEGHCMVMRMEAYLPVSLMVLPTAFWPAETAPYHAMMAKLLDGSHKPRPYGMIANKKMPHRVENEVVMREVLEFVEPFGKAKSHFVTMEWRRVWLGVLAIDEVWRYVARPVKQAGTCYNRNSIAHIIALMKEQRVLEGTSKELAALQPLCNKNFRVNMSSLPDQPLREVLRNYCDKVKRHTRLR